MAFFRIIEGASVYLELVLAPDGQKNLPDPHPSCSAVGLAIGAPHSGLQPEGEE